MNLRLAVLAPELPSISGTFVFREVTALRALGAHVQCWSLHEPSPNGLAADAEPFLREVDVLYATPGRLLRDAWVQALRQPRPALRALGCAVRDTFCGTFARPAQRWRVLGQALAGLGLARRLRRRGVQHLHVHFAHAPATVGMYAAIAADRPFSITAHANDLYVEGSLLREKLARAAAFVTVAEANRRHLQRQVGNGACNVQVVRCGVDTTLLAQRPGEPLDGPLLAVGRLVAKKGFDVLLRALVDVPQVRLVIAGDGPERGQLTALCEQLGLGDRVTFCGTVDRARITGLLRTARAFVLPCRVAGDGDRDGVPVVLMEAMACGVPVVSTPVGGIGELIEAGVHGTIVPPDDAAALARGLRQVLRAGPALRPQIDAARQRVVERFDLQRNAAQLHALLLLASKRHMHGVGTLPALQEA